ncbi:ThuA domain-containing protein [Chryseolinea sp. H1M3-3]|uniref:ThuA domain-containing protein n=1 Tax=Chryseolinea sp. H1M3-3 TaxID=3034144 RepID=UPI0023EBA020|nr:ThuA domain-containing protein [Chryseolinea sp. H1M3-3]
MIKTAVTRFNLLIALNIAAVLCGCADFEHKPSILIVTKTKGWKHTSIDAGVEALQRLGAENNFTVDTTKDSKRFNDEDLKRYDAVVFLNTTGNILNAEQQASFERYIQAGGGFVGIHSAAATEYEWPWYNKLVGAHFASHPINPGTRKGVIDVTNNNHPATVGLPSRWERNEEWYNFGTFYPGINVLAQLDENSYEGGTHGTYHPIAWYHEYDGGRSFYTAVGHENSSFSEPLVAKHILGGIKYAMGDGKKDYKKARAVTVPEENRFVKTILVNDLNTPMELAVSKDGLVFFTELRTANLYVFNTKTGKNSIAHRFDVCTRGGTGLIGLTLDPKFESNRNLYVYYSPPIEGEPIYFHLSRFTVKVDNTLDITSEKILLKVPVEENSGAHHGGSLAWDKEGNLYLSTGDSSSPFPANGYAPLDERPGKEFYSLDAQRSSANTNDLKGKILRIHPEPDGTYTIPEGNLYAKGTEKTLPEIYVMGCRNPYRIAVNPKTSVLYWGEIGPDAGKDSIQGPRGYDEFNQAKEPGNFGWPYFVGNNEAYFDWDFATNTAGARFNPASPENISPNNTGLTKLKPAIPAMIYYPYEPSKEFPALGQGGRSAMAGEFYTFSKAADSENKFPEYYDGSLFVFDWMRNWVLALRFDQNENYLYSEPFMATTGDFRRPIDLAFGSDGVMYMLEYGSVYGADNADARLVKIEYNTGNRAPIASAGIPDPENANWNSKVFLTNEQSTVQLKEIEGEAPLKITFSSANSRDLDDDDALSYEWTFDGKIKSSDPNPTFTYNAHGKFHAILKVTDKNGSTDTDTVVVLVGNTKPTVSIVSADNKSFYWDNKPFRYSVKVTDKEDPVIDPSKVSLTVTYNPDGGMQSSSETIARPKLIQTAEPIPLGYAKILSSDCKACHTIDKKSVGPTYTAISERYKNKTNALETLSKKIIAGGGGNWGTEHVMSAHPQLSADDTKQMVQFILSITDPNIKRKLPLTGAVNFTSHKPNENPGIYTLTARYTDQNANGATTLSDNETILLRSASMRPIDADAHIGIDRWGNAFGSAKNKSYIFLKSIDLSGIKNITYDYGSESRGGEIVVRLESLAGPVISRTKFEPTGGEEKRKTISSAFDMPVSGRHHIYVVIENKEKTMDDLCKLWSFTFN